MQRLRGLYQCHREEIKWLKKERKLFDKTEQKIVAAPFYQVNAIDDYNHFIGNADMADQMRGSYRFDHWMRRRKWWWSIVFRHFKYYSQIHISCTKIII